MNIHAERFDKVKYLDEKLIPFGYWSETEFANKYLIHGNEYTVGSMVIDDDGCIRVRLLESNAIFHPALFEDVRKEALPIRNKKMRYLTDDKPSKEPVHIKGIMDKVLPDFFTLQAQVYLGLEDAPKTPAKEPDLFQQFVVKNLPNFNKKEFETDQKIQNQIDHGILFGQSDKTERFNQKKDWSENLYIPRQTIDRHSAFDDHFKIIGVLDRGVRKSKHLKFNNFDWNQLFNRTISKHVKHGKEVEYETWHILSFIGDKKFTIIAERRNN